MASRYYRDNSSVSEDDVTSRSANDLRLRQAISYLGREGGPDPPAIYIDRVHKLDGMLQQYRSEGYSFDGNLYRQLRSMIRERQDEIRRVADEESSVALDDSDESIEELVSPEALYREDDYELRSRPTPQSRRDVQSAPAIAESSKTPQSKRTPRSSYAPVAEDFAADVNYPDLSSKVKGPKPLPPSFAKPPPSAPKPSSPLKKAEVRETQFLYGGPKNEVEQWHKDFPATLPFGETLYMQEWESMKINYDLAESAKRLGTDDPIVNTNVPYDAVKQNFRQEGKYDSGSRFKLPQILKTTWNLIQSFTSTEKLDAVVDDFNEGGGLEEPKGKDYVPRIFLPQVAISREGKERGPIPRVELSQNAAARRKFNRFGTINPDVLPQVRKHAQRAPKAPAFDQFDDLPELDEVDDFHLGKSQPRTTKFATVSASVPKRKSTTPVAKRIANQREASRVTKPAPITRRATHVSVPSPKRGPGRPPRAAAPAPPPAPKTTRTTAGKRKLAEADDSYTEAKKPKVTKKAAGKKVAFAKEAEVQTSKKTPAAKKRAATQGALKKTPVSVEPKPTHVLEGSEKVKRGTTRSGTKFK